MDILFFFKFLNLFFLFLWLCTIKPLVIWNPVHVLENNLAALFHVWAGKSIGEESCPHSQLGS